MNIFKSVTKSLRWFIALLMVSLMVGCGGTDDAAPLSSAKSITSFTIGGVVGTIDQTAKTIALTVPNATSVTAMVATFTVTGGSVTVGTVAQVSATTANDFSSPVTYIVTAADGSTASYVVTVTVAGLSDKAITTYSLNGATGTISGATSPFAIAVTVPNGTNVTAMVATFSTTGTGVAVAATPQTSGTTANDFAAPVTYVVTAANSTTATYVVTVTVAGIADKAITSYSLGGVSGSITGASSPYAIAVSLPAGTTVTGLIATFTTDGSYVTVGATTQVSTTTANDFSSPVSYTVHAADTSTAVYVVTVTVASSSTVLPGIAGTAGANATNPTANTSNPRNAATNVATSTNSWIAAANASTGKLVTATFNEAMNSGTITAVGTFTLKTTTGNTDVPGTVTMNAANTIATFTPTASALAASTSYTATISTAAQNAGGTAMPKAVAWTFTTNATVLTGQAPVSLLTAGDFAILANAGLTCNGACPGVAGGVTGDIGTTALASIAGFTLTPDALNDFATAVEVVSPGKVYTPNYTGGAIGSTNATPAKMVLAGTDMTLAYNDGAGRTPAAGAPFLEAGSPTVGTLDGLTLAPGVYTWAGSVISSAASSVTLSGGPDDVWIFQIGGYFRPGNGSNMILSNPSGGAPPQAKNIFWVVAGTDATLGTTAHLEGVILTGTGYITLNGGSTVNGRLLSKTAATLDGTVTQPAP